MKKVFILVMAMVIAMLSMLHGSAANVATEEMRAVWVATVYSIDFPHEDGETAQKEEIRSILNTTKEAGLNTVFFQVRPTGDAYYQSDIFPWAESLTGTAGKDPGWDPLAYMIEEGSKLGIEIHAWINPYRLTQGTTGEPNNKVTDLPEGHPVRDNPSMAVSYDDGKLYLDPGDPDAVELVVAGVREIVENYDVAGIHFDDYFYPSPSVSKDGKTYTAVFDDADTYALYGGNMGLADWRRSNTTALVEEVYDTVKSIDPNCDFGISPSGIWRNEKNDPLGSDTNGFESHTAIYADTRGWVKAEIIDYICPQIYWPFGYSAADYETLVRWWSDVCSGTDVDLVIGHAAYKVGSSSPSDWLDKWEIARQVEFNRELGTVYGSAFYGLSKIQSNTLDLKTTLATLFEGAPNSSGSDSTPTTPTTPTTPPTTSAGDTQKAEDLVIAYPYSGADISSSKSYIIGAGDPAYPIVVNGNEIARTESGYFAMYVDLDYGTNTFVFEHKGETRNYTINRPSGGGGTTTPPYVMETAGFRSGSLWPSSDGRYAPGETFTLSCTAPSGVSVTATHDGTVYQLTEGERVSSEGIPSSKYSVNVTMTEREGAGLINTGVVTYKFTYGGKTYTSDSDAVVYCYMLDPTLTASILNEATIMRVSNSSSADRITPMYIGATDYVVWETPSYYQLRYGGWTLKENVTTSNQTLPANFVTAMNVFTSPTKTTVRWKVPYFPAYQTVEGDTFFEITLHNTSGKTVLPLPENPLFSLVSVRTSGTSSVYTFETKREGGIYGYKISYVDGYLTIAFDNPPTAGATILIDAGHGGSDPGATGPLGSTGDMEAQLNLRVSQAVRDKLEALGFNVIMTRDGEESITLVERATMIREHDPALAISIHHNSLGASSDISKYFGVITFYTENQSKRFAEVMQAELSETVGYEKTTDYRNMALAVGRIQECPSILLEMGYISNPYNYEKLSSQTYIEVEAQGIVNGILAFINS